jgi:hypothetical protein
VAVAAAFASDGFTGGAALASNWGVRGVGASAAIQVRKGGILNVTGTLWGAGNGLVGTDVREGGRVAVLAAITPTLASVGQELQLEGAATANGPPPLATGVIPAATALTTWVQWTGGAFVRNVMSYFTGSAISNAA